LSNAKVSIRLFFIENSDLLIPNPSLHEDYFQKYFEFLSPI